MNLLPNMKDFCLKKSGLARLVERGTRQSASTIINLSSGMGIASSSMVMVSPLVMAESTVTWAAPVFFTLTFTLATRPDGCFLCALKFLSLGGRFTGSPISRSPIKTKNFLCLCQTKVSTYVLLDRVIVPWVAPKKMLMLSVLRETAEEIGVMNDILETFRTATAGDLLEGQPIVDGRNSCANK